MAFVQGKHAGGRGDHARVFDRFSTGQPPNVRTLSEPSAGRLYVELPMRPAPWIRDHLPGTVWELHSPSTYARHRLDRHRYGGGTLPFHAALVVRGPNAAPGKARLA